MPVAARNLTGRDHLIANGPVLAGPELPELLFDDRRPVARKPSVQFSPRVRLSDVGGALAVTGARQIVDVSNVARFPIGAGDEQMPARVQEREHAAHGRVMLLDVLQGADAGDKVEAIREASVPNVVVENVVMPVQHSLRPVVPNIVGRGHEESAVAHQVGQGRCSRSDVDDRFGIELGELPEDKPEFNRPLVEPPEFL